MQFNFIDGDRKADFNQGGRGVCSQLLRINHKLDLDFQSGQWPHQYIHPSKNILLNYVFRKLEHTYPHPTNLGLHLTVEY